MLMQSHFLNLILLYLVWASKLVCAYLCVLFCLKAGQYMIFDSHSSHLGLHISIRFVRVDIYHTGHPTMTHL